ncbi:MAG: prolyl oligopeptidase family serine peptidase, partial [Thermoplasmata archaeon]
WSELYLVDLETSETRPVPLAEPGTILGVVWTPDGSGIVVDVSSPTAGAEVYLCELAEGTCRALTHAPVGLPGHVPAPHLGSFTSSDGLRIPYWELRPDRQNPRGTIVWVHGGPEAQARPTFMPFVSFLVLEGWRLILPNVRGSTGYGRTYVHLDDVRRRMDSVRDLRELVRALAALGDAVPGRVGVIGASYGGFMVLSAITTYPELWGAAVDIVGIANFVTFLERTGPWRRKVREDEYGSLERDRAFLESISPIHFSDRIRSPLLVVHGQNDPRVPVSEADQIVAALKSRRVPVEYLRYANEGHGLVRRENRLEAYARAAEFFANHLDPAAPTT